MINLSKAEEDVLQTILDHYVKNDKNSLLITNNDFPQYTSCNLRQYLEFLKNRSLIASFNQTNEDIEIYLTPDGINYFANKKKRMFPKNSMDLLHQLLNQEKPEEYMQSLFKDLDHNADSRLRAMMRYLREEGYIETSWADDVPDHIEFNEKAYTIDEEGMREMANGTYIFTNITNGNANINSIDNSIRNTNISNNEIEVFERMLEVASNIAEEEKKDIIMAIEDMRNDLGKPTLKEKYYKFIEVAADHMTLFAPFLPVITEMFLKIQC